MNYINVYWEDLKVQLKASIFLSEDRGSEIHSTLEITDSNLIAEVQFKNIQKALQRIELNNIFDGATLIWKRFFVRDASNQHLYINDDLCTINSIVQQPPLNGTKVALWLYYIAGNNVITREDNNLIVHRDGGSKYLYTTKLHIPLKN